MHRLTNDQFIAKANDIHNNKYGYDQVNYKTSHVKIKVKCDQHDYFLVSPNNHLNGRGCPQCGLQNTVIKQRLTLEQFKQKAILIHGNKYNYSKVDYNGMHSKITITCPDHGDFEQTPSSHLKGNGCHKCSILFIANKRRLSIQDFIEKAKFVHGDKYIYDDVDYKNFNTKVVIICKKHGEFKQTPGSHIGGNGCPNCSESKGELAIKSILDKYNISYLQEYRLNVNYLFRYDFYLPELNILIEFHGGQHFKPIEFFGGIEHFNYVRKNDIFKKELAKLANVPIIYFTYKHLRLNPNKFEELLMLVINKISLRSEQCYH